MGVWSVECQKLIFESLHFSSFLFHFSSSNFPHSFHSSVPCDNYYDPQTACLLCLEAYFSADTAGCDMMLQSVLAPPPPKADLGAGFQNAASSTSEDGCPLAAMLLAILISGCASSESGDATAPPSPAATVRAANVLALLFVHGGKLGRELGSAMATSHVRAALGGDEPGQSNFAVSLP